MTEIRITVFGTPAAAGSKRAFAIKKGGEPTGRFSVTDANKKAGPWKDLIRKEAAEVMQGKALLRDVPLRVSFTFYVRRPQGHFGKRGLLPSAPAFPTKKPDALKLARAVEDALTGIVYQDDALIASGQQLKRWGEPERVEISIALEDPAAGEMRGNYSKDYSARNLDNVVKPVRQAELLPI